MTWKPTAILAAQDVCYTHRPGAPPALSDISLTVREGERIAVIGPSGAGKSTLALLLADLIRPTRGQIVRRPPKESPGPEGGTRDVAIVFSDPEIQVVASTVEEDVAFGPENLGLHSDEIRLRVDRALDAAGVQSLAKRSVNGLSGGERQLVAIAGALALRPSCLILDEATAMLHAKARRRVEKALTTLLEDGVAVVHMTHDLEEAAGADRVALLYQGKLMRVGSPLAVLCDEDLLARCRLAPPETVQLASALRRRGFDLRPTPLGLNDLTRAIDEAVRR